MSKNAAVPLAPVRPIASLKPQRGTLRGRPVVRIHLLGPMRATTYLGANVLPPGKRARAVLGYLCLAGGQLVARADLAGLLWDRVSSQAARTNLRQALHELTSFFGELGNELITGGRDVVRLNVEACWVDALAALELDPVAVDIPHGELLALCRGELLEDLDGASASFDRWLLGERARVSGRLQALLERELRRAEARSNAARALTRALASLRERARTLEEYTRRKQRWQTALQAEGGRPTATA
jgi:DNA-binding SARP family transcriptional activator